MLEVPLFRHHQEDAVEVFFGQREHAAKSQGWWGVVAESGRKRRCRQISLPDGPFAQRSTAAVESGRAGRSDHLPTGCSGTVCSMERSQCLVVSRFGKAVKLSVRACDAWVGRRSGINQQHRLPVSSGFWPAAQSSKLLPSEGTELLTATDFQTLLRSLFKKREALCRGLRKAS